MCDNPYCQDCHKCRGHTRGKESNLYDVKFDPNGRRLLYENGDKVRDICIYPQKSVIQNVSPSPPPPVVVPVFAQFIGGPPPPVVGRGLEATTFIDVAAPTPIPRCFWMRFATVYMRLTILAV